MFSHISVQKKSFGIKRNSFAYRKVVCFDMTFNEMYRKWYKKIENKNKQPPIRWIWFRICSRKTWKIQRKLLCRLWLRFRLRQGFVSQFYFYNYVKGFINNIMICFYFCDFYLFEVVYRHGVIRSIIGNDE